jgi:hypothetical protein
MRTAGKPGIVVRIPKDPDASLSLGSVIAQLSEARIDVRATSSSLIWETILDGHELFAEAIFVCLDESEVERCVAGALPDESLILIDADGARVAGAAVPNDALATAHGFLSMSRGILHGAGAERLHRRSRTCDGPLVTMRGATLDAFLTKPILASVARVGIVNLARVGSAFQEWRPPSGGDTTFTDYPWLLLKEFDDDLSNASARTIFEAAERFLPFVIRQRLESPSESVGYRARALIEAIYWSEVAKRNTFVLPYGLAFAEPADTSSACVCGMASVSRATTRTFLGFVSR